MFGRGQPVRSHGQPTLPAHDTERRAIGPEPRGNPAAQKKTPISHGRWALQQLIHRGSGSTDSTMSSDPPRRRRRTFPLDYTFDFPMSGESPRGGACGRHTHASRSARRRFARRHDDPYLMIDCPSTCSAVHPRRPTGTGRPGASRLHVVVRNEPGLFGWNEKPHAHVTAINGETNSRAGRRFIFATRHVAIRSVLILLSPSSMRPTH